jgi:hypothetical protein
MKLIAQTENQIDWDTVIRQCSLRPGVVLHYNNKSFDDTDPAFAKMNTIWQQAGYVYDDPAIEWINYFPGTDFAESVVPIFRDIVNAQPWMVWVSRIRPGKMAPWHFDAHSKIKEILTLGTPVRYTCYIQEPSNGHVSIVGNKAIYRPTKGSVYQWENYNDWHCGMNGGVTDKYMFNYWGYV